MNPILGSKSLRRFAPSGRTWYWAAVLLAGAFALYAGLMVFAWRTVTVAVGADLQGIPVFSMSDPAGDDYGSGSVTYPLDQAFVPRGFLDLKSFEIRLEQATVDFDIVMGALANPWNAPEGFYHPRIDIFMHTGAPGGATRPLRDGLPVDFDQRWPWHVWLRIAPFGGAALFTWQDDPAAPGRRRGIKVTSIQTQNRIHISVPHQLIPTPDRNWRYYVIVGSFDGFGTDGYRQGTPTPSRWLLGGLPEGSPPIVDLLAPAWGPRRQERQLSHAAGSIPVLQPVGGRDIFRVAPGWYVLLVTLSILSSLRLRLVRRWIRRLPNFVNRKRPTD